MKAGLKRTLFQISIYVTAAILIFTLVFAVIYNVSYNEMYFPHQKMKLNGAKNLLQEIPVIEYAEEKAPDLEDYQGEEIQGEFVKKP